MIVEQSQAADYPNLLRSTRHWVDVLEKNGFTLHPLLIRVSSDAEDAKPRHLAMTAVSRTQIEIVLSPKLEGMPSAKRDGVIIHELGHVLSFLCGNNTHSEREADSVAEAATGQKIYYGEDLIQTTSPKGIRPRPGHLR